MALATRTGSSRSTAAGRPFPKHPRGYLPPEAPRTLPCPTTGRPLAIAAIDTNSQALCPRCLTAGRGAFISFVSDLRLAYACPSCEELVWGEGL